MSKITLRPYQQTAVDEIREALVKYRRVLFQLPTGGGKCFGADTPILMFDGSIKMVQDVKAGDLLMGDDSTPRKVISTCIGHEEMFRITPIKGTPFECNKSHILSLRYSDKAHGNAIRNVCVDEYLKLRCSQKHLLKLYRSGVEFEHQDLPIDPYILGLWIADGTKTNGCTEISVNKRDNEIIKYLISIGGRFLPDNKRGLNYHRITLSGIRNKNGNRVNSNIYRDEFKKCLFNQHYDIGIPDEYKINSKYNRLQLLAGILDGDGNTDCIKSGYEITTKYKRLADDILYLSRSLGLAAYVHTKKVDLSKIKNCVSTDIRTYYRITISGFCESIPLKLVRKRSLSRKMNKNVLNVGFSIESIGLGTYYGFEIIGNNRLFLLGDFTVAHNTVCFSYMAKSSQKYNRKVLIISDRTEILMQNGGALERFGMDVYYINPSRRSVPTKNISVGMAQTLKRRIEKPEWEAYVRSLDLVIIDECHAATSDFIHNYLSNKCFVLGCTATPRRYGNTTQLGSLYAAMVQGISTRELVDMGYLAKPHLYSVAAPKLDIPIDQGIGDYNRKALAAKYEDRILYKGVVSEWMRLTPNTKTIVFCCSSKQTIDVCKEFNEIGVSARYVLSGEFEDDSDYSGNRSDIFQAFKNNEFTVLVNLNIATAGLDVPDIQTVILNFATVSITRYRQAMGRGCRVCDGKTDFNVLDCGENTRRHGGFLSEQNWCLWHDTHTGDGMQMLKKCDETKPDRNGKLGCGTMIPNTCKVCPKCGKILVDEKWDYVLHLEEVKEEAQEESIENYVTTRRLDGWSIPRIMISLCCSNPDNMRKAFIRGYMTLCPEKTEKDAGKYYYVFMKQFKDKIKTRRAT